MRGLSLVAVLWWWCVWVGFWGRVLVMEVSRGGGFGGWGLGGCVVVCETGAGWLWAPFWLWVRGVVGCFRRAGLLGWCWGGVCMWFLVGGGAVCGGVVRSWLCVCCLLCRWFLLWCCRVAGLWVDYLCCRVCVVGGLVAVSWGTGPVGWWVLSGWWRCLYSWVLVAWFGLCLGVLGAVVFVIVVVLSVGGFVL